jgi:hypothetical protein
MKTSARLLLAAMFWLATSLGQAEPVKNLASSILTLTLAEQILGADLEPDRVNSQPDINSVRTLISHCAYAARSSGRNAPHVDLMVHISDNADMAKGQFDGAKAVHAGKDVTGLGDAAFRSSLPGQLNVLKGRVCITITAGTFKANAKMEEEVASQILGRLPE